MELDSILGDLLLISIFNTWVSKNCLSPISTPTPLPLVHQVIFIFLFTLQARMVNLKADMCGWLVGEQRVVRNCRRTISAPTYFLIGIPLYSAETYGIICWDLGASFIAPSGLNSAYTIVHHESVYNFGLCPSVSVWSKNEILLCIKWRSWLQVVFILFWNETDKILNL